MAWSVKCLLFIHRDINTVPQHSCKKKKKCQARWCDLKISALEKAERHCGPGGSLANQPTQISELGGRWLLRNDTGGCSLASTGTHKTKTKS